MDNLARNAMLARQAGMSYGRWKALQPIVPIKKPEIPKGGKKCKGCGTVFFTTNRKKQYCDEVCRRSCWERRKKRGEN